ncbi:MAG: ATP-binding protein [Gammaproteobacteria bacterium]|nr:ATP-binding protein [Gammaproteobacteria bacterium]
MNLPAGHSQSGVTTQGADTLISAFEHFEQISEQLQKTYMDMDQRAALLTQELIAARQDRLQQTSEEEKLTERLSKLLAALPAGVVLTNRLNVIQESNPAADKFFKQVLRGKNWQQIIEASTQYQDGKDIHLKNGNILSITRQQLDDAGEIILINDVTDTRMLEDLANRQKRLAAMGQMAAGLAHQLRTPLTSAVLYASQLTKTDIKPEHQVRAVGKIRTSLRYLEKLINDMLMYAKGGEFTDEPFSLNQLLLSFYSRMETRLKQTQSIIKIDNQIKSISLKGSMGSLVSVLTNVADNALDACQRNCIINLDIYQQNQYLVIAMRDNGPGLTVEQQQNVFEPFYTEKTNGTGLGLAVARTIAQAHKGDLFVKSVVGQGCTFSLCLPLDQGEQFLPSGRNVNAPVED